MSLNLGAAAFDAVQRFKNTEDWKIVVAALNEQMVKFMHAAVETGEPKSCGYALGLRDVVWAFEVIEAGPNAPQRATQKPNIGRPPNVR